MWHVSAPHRPCIGHRTGYSLHENARISGLASADFEGVFAHSYRRWRPRLFLRALRKAERSALAEPANGQGVGHRDCWLIVAPLRSNDETSEQAHTGERLKDSPGYSQAAATAPGHPVIGVEG